MFSSKHSKLVQTQVCWCWGVCHTKSSEIYFFLEPLLANLELSFALCTNLSPPHLLTFPPDAVQVISISVLGPNLPLLRHVLLCHCWYSSCFHIFCCYLCPLNVSNHFSHLAFARLSCIFTRCLSNNNCPSLHLRGLPYIHNLSITPSCLSPLGGHLEPPSRLSLLPDWASISPSSCSTWSLAATGPTAPLLFGRVFWCLPEAIDTFHCSRCLRPALWCSQIHCRHRSAVHKHGAILQWRAHFTGRHGVLTNSKCWNCSVKCRLQQ